MRSLIIAAILLAACLPLFAADDPNIPTITDEQVQKAVLDVLSKNPELFEIKSDTELAVEKLTKEYYKDTSDRQNNAFYALLGLVAVSIVYVVYVDRQKYKDALARAENAAVRAEKICDHTELLEQRAQAVFENIDRDANAKLKEIEAEKQAGIATLDRDVKIKLEEIELKLKELKGVGTEITTEAEKQRKISSYCDKAHGASNLAYSEQDDSMKKRLLAEAAGNYEKIIQLEGDKTLGYHNKSYILLKLYHIEQNPTKKQDILKEIKALCERAESLEPGDTAYNMACCFALQGDLKNCRHWLEVSKQHGRLPSKEQAMSDPDLKSVRNRKWFKEIGWITSEIYIEGL